jgi:hypothetical protein
MAKIFEICLNLFKQHFSPFSISEKKLMAGYTVSIHFQNLLNAKSSICVKNDSYRDYMTNIWLSYFLLVNILSYT